MLIVGSLIFYSLVYPAKYMIEHFEIMNKESNSFHLAMLNDRENDFSIVLPCSIGLIQSIWVTEFFGGPAFRFDAGPNYLNLLLGLDELDGI